MSTVQSSVAPTVNLEVVPSNIQSNGIISYRDGNPIIQFIIGEQARGLVGRSVRLVGDFAVRNNTGDGDDSYVDPDDDTFINNRLGIYNVIDRLVIKSQVTHQTIEDIKFYNRFCSSFIPILNSLGDMTGHLSNTALIMPNFAAFKNSVLAIPSQRGSGNSFCAHLPCGLFNGLTAPIPLMATKGLLVEIHLAPDQSVLYTQDGSSGPLANSYYELRDVRLCCEAVNMDSATSGTFEYNSISSYYTSINSTNAVLNFNLGLSRVLGAFMNFLPAQNINNLRCDGMSTSNLLGAGNSYGQGASNDFPAFITQCVFMKGAQRFPLEYNLDLLQADKPNDLGNTGTQNNSVDGSLQRNFMDSVQSFSTIGRSAVSRDNTYYMIPEGQLSQTDSIGGYDKGVINGGGVHGVGIAYDSISDQGQNFSTDNWGVNMTTGLTKDTPHSVFLFIHAKQTLTFNQGGVQVVS
tara:strand:- start:425 stop:1813 length:1389 start_codon:yes stop_codon:yes gene_type:complete